MSRKVQAASAAIGAATAIGVGGFAVPAIAHAASTSPSPSATTGSATPRDGARHKAAEQELSGAAAAKVKAAVLAKLPGATIHRASAEDPAEGNGAAYEVHAVKADGSRVRVLLNTNFAVISTRTEAHHGGRDGRGGAHARSEQELSGAIAAKVKATVLAGIPGATIDRMSAEDPAEGNGAAYEAHVTKADGTHVVVLLDKNFAVKGTRPEIRPAGFDGPFPGGPPAADSASTGTAGSGGVTA